MPAESATAGAEHSEYATDLGIVVGLVSLGTAFIAAFFLDLYRVHWLPESAISVSVGVVACYIVIYAESEDLPVMEFNMDFFMDWLIPPIIFEAAFNMNVSAFFANLRPTLFFAFAGTVFSTFVVAAVVFYAGQLGLCYALSPLAALTFGSLISATDPVAVLATFQELGVSSDLFSMVFGEAVLNDAVAIVLTRTLISFAVEAASAESIAASFVAFLQIFIGSSLLGLLAGVLSALVFKHLRLREHSETVFLEVVLSFTFPWSSYFAAEACGYSGIVAILFCGMCFATYTRVNVSAPGLQLMAGTYKCIAKIAETFVFVYLGMACVRMAKVGLFDGTVWRLAAWGVLGCFLGRTHVFLGSALVNQFRGPYAEPPRISRDQMLVMWLSGLRGGVAFAIIAKNYQSRTFRRHCGGVAYAHSQLAANDCHTEGVADDGTAMLQTTMLIAVFTTFVLGGAMPTIARLLELTGSPKAGGSVHSGGGGGGRGSNSRSPPVPAGSSSSPHPQRASLSKSGSAPAGVLKFALDNKAAPLLHTKTPRSPSPPNSQRSSPLSPSAAESAPLVDGPMPLIEESHSWLVRLLTNDTDYDWFAHVEQDREARKADRFIGRGSLGHAAGAPTPVRSMPHLRRWKSHGSIPVRALVRSAEDSSPDGGQSGGNGGGAVYEPPQWMPPSRAPGKC